MSPVHELNTLSPLRHYRDLHVFWAKTHAPRVGRGGRVSAMLQRANRTRESVCHQAQTRKLNTLLPLRHHRALHVFSFHAAGPKRTAPTIGRGGRSVGNAPESNRHA